MPEFMGIKITRAEESARHRYRKALEKALRTVAKGSGWRTTQGILFKEHQGWLYSVWSVVSIFQHETHVSLQIKPLAIDPIFWEIADIPGNKDQPLSFRLLGAFVCNVPAWASDRVQESDEPVEVAGRVLQWANLAFERAAGSISTPGFIQTLKANPLFRERGRYGEAIVCAALLSGEQHEAMAICEQALDNGWQGDFIL